MHNTREFLIVFISKALFAKCWVFAVQMTFASYYFIWNTLCVNCKAPQTVQRSMTAFLQLYYSTYVPKQGQIQEFLPRLNIMLLQRGAFLVDSQRFPNTPSLRGKKVNLILPFHYHAVTKNPFEQKKKWKYFCCFFYDNIAGYDSA